MYKTIPSIFFSYLILFLCYCCKVLRHSKSQTKWASSRGHVAVWVDVATPGRPQAAGAGHRQTYCHPGLSRRRVAPSIKAFLISLVTKKGSRNEVTGGKTMV